MMEQYLIGGGAVLEAGARSTITRATLHAQIREECQPKAVLIDFEAGSFADVSRLLVLGSGFTAERFETTVTAKFLQRGVCGFDDVAAILAECLETDEVHVFSRWEATAEMAAALQARGIRLRAHALDQIERAALVTETRLRIWDGPSQAA